MNINTTKHTAALSQYTLQLPLLPPPERIRKCRWLVISNVFLKIKDFSRSQAANVVI